MRSVGWPRDVKTARSATPRTLLIAALILSAVSVSTTTSLPISFTEFSPLTPDTASSTLSWMYCEKLKLTPGNFASRASLTSSMSLSLVIPLRHSFAGLSGAKNSALKKPVGIGAVIGPSLLGHDRLDFGKISDHQPHAVDEVITLFERDRRRHGCANPEIALLQVRQEFEAQESDGNQREGEQ